MHVQDRLRLMLRLMYQVDSLGYGSTDGFNLYRPVEENEHRFPQYFGPLPVEIATGIESDDADGVLAESKHSYALLLSCGHLCSIFPD